MNFIEVKTADLVGAALDWSVGNAIGWIEPIFGIGQISYIQEDAFLMMAEPDPDEPEDVALGEHFNHYTQWSPSRLWSQGGPLRDKYQVEILECYTAVHAKLAGKTNSAGHGETALIAICRAIVASVLGDTVSVPKELCHE